MYLLVHLYGNKLFPFIVNPFVEIVIGTKLHGQLEKRLIESKPPFSQVYRQKNKTLRVSERYLRETSAVAMKLFFRASESFGRVTARRRRIKCMHMCMRAYLEDMKTRYPTKYY